MTDQLLEILKFALLALLYLFFARVLWAVWSEVRGPRAGQMMMAPVELTPNDPTRPATIPAPAKRAKRTKRGVVTKLVVLQPRERKGASFAVVTEITVGRAASCTIVIGDDSFVSQVHARLYQGDGCTWVDDLGSTNGSYLNGARLSTPQPIGKGDRLQVGSSVFEAH
jgi:pSer/pThr/pTyr-binding forkhead associated (FHA) protein